MRTRVLCCVAISAAFAAPFALRTAQSQQDAGGAPQPTPEQMGEMMKEWMASTQPGEMHKMLAKSVGDWDTTTKVFWGGPDAPASETKGTAKVTAVLGGRFVHEQMKGSMSMPDATGAMKESPFEGFGLIGYDNYRHVFVGTWCDNMTTAILSFRGTMPPGSQTITMYGEMDEPMLKMVGRTVKYETRYVDDDTHVFSMYDLAAGPDYKVIEVTYKRKK